MKGVRSIESYPVLCARGETLLSVTVLEARVSTV
jgi:hypothetical protein